MRRGAAFAAGVIGAGIVAYPVILVRADQGMLALASLSAAFLVAALVMPRLPLVLSGFCALWCVQYALGLFAAHPGPDPLAPAMAAGLYLVVELTELAASAHSGVAFSNEILTRRLVTAAVVPGAAVVLGAASIAAGGLLGGGGLAGVVLAAVSATVVMAIPTVAGRGTYRRG